MYCNVKSKVVYGIQTFVTKERIQVTYLGTPFQEYKLEHQVHKY